MGNTGPEEFRVVKDMTISHAEFFRIAQRLLESEQHEVRGDGVIIRRDEGSIEIELGSEGVRAMGAIRLPRTRVELVFRAVSPDAVGEFLASFETRFRRGGG